MKKRVASQTRKRASSRTLDITSSMKSLPQFSVSGGSDLLDRLSAIPLLFDSSSIKRTVSVPVGEDSWASGKRVGLRDVLDGHLRRIAFTKDPFRFELVAERRQRQWEFVGRFYCRGRVVNDMVLILGRRRVLPGIGGFFHWTSPGVVRHLGLTGPRRTFTLECIVW